MGWGLCILWIELLFGGVRNLNALSFVLSESIEFVLLNDLQY
jgi:hypothetical protein